ncbi:MAG: haloacid dehalogenase type II [Celeribacter sp.]|jgi:2-haloacid dehalogenase
MPITTCIFDAYGTLFDVAASARNAAAEPGREAFAAHATELSAIWRQKQLEYTWLRAITGAHSDFEQVTADALDYAMESLSVPDENGLRARLMELYRTLDAHPEVPEMLRALQSLGMNVAILSNGSPAMLDAAARSAGIDALLDDILSVETVGVFKPAAQVYDMVGARFGCAPDQVLFASSNGWDAGCATGYGFATLWANRGGAPVDRLPWRPTHMAPDLSGFVALAEGLK